MMKKINLFAIILISISLYSCQPEDIKPIGEERDIISLMRGNWKVESVIQSDEYAKSKAFPFKEMDVTNLYAYKDIAFTFNTEGKNPSTCTVTFGNAPKFFEGTAAKWSVDNLEKPQIITFKDSGNGDLGTIQMGNYTSLDQGKLTLKVVRYQVDDKGVKTPVVSYSYVLIKN